MGEIKEHGMRDAGREGAHGGLQEGPHGGAPVAVHQAPQLVRIGGRHALCGEEMGLKH